ncbi:MAG: hypothetical protein ACD_73C00256G0004 [uncultured bacterium]|nr:MAG: hypothetical protein ACD_73C00256G0004 [uncultured bacterium]
MPSKVNQMILTEAVLKYLSGFPAHLEWHQRGLTGHHKKDHANQEYQEAVILMNEFLGSREGQLKISDFSTEVLSVCQELKKRSKDFIRVYLGPKKFYFIVGAMRSGGTYLFTECCKAHHIDYTQMNLQMVHDGVPSYANLVFWQQPPYYEKLLIELAQWLVWVKNVFTHHDVIVHKRIGLAHALPLWDHLFGDQAHYLVTLRHPLTSSESFARMEKLSTQNEKLASPLLWEKFIPAKLGIKNSEWLKKNYFERFLDYWFISYKDIISASPYKGHLAFIPYEKLSDYVLNELKVSDSSPFMITPYEPNPSWPHPDHVNKLFAVLNQLGTLMNLSFPKEMPLC